MLHAKPKLSMSHAKLLFYISLNTNAVLESGQETLFMPPTVEGQSSQDLSINKVTNPQFCVYALVYSVTIVALTRAAYLKGRFFQAFGIG